VGDHIGQAWTEMMCVDTTNRTTVFAAGRMTAIADGIELKTVTKLSPVAANKKAC
jgi:hypothetical protein